MKRIISFLAILIIIHLFGLNLPQKVEAAPPTNFQITQIIGSGLDGTTGFDFAPDGRIFILQRTGEVKVYKAGKLLSTNFTTLPSIASGDRGLIGIAFDPDYASNHYVYFYYTGLDKLNRLIRFDASEDVGKNAHVLYQTTSPSEQLHVGGSIGFGPDGKLYFAIGDNGYPPNSQNLDNPHGKILRINKDGSIPADNPFYGQTGKKWEIWAYGMRNPWRFQFDKVTGRLYAGDVGNSTWEEINLIEKGKNYGWPNAEGYCNGCPYTNPVYAYAHIGDSSAVTGGFIYRGNMFPSSYIGKYFFSDYGQGFIKVLSLSTDGKTGTPQDFDNQAGSVVDLKMDHDGSVYYITFYPARLYRISYATDNHIPVANATADKNSGIPPFQVQFSSAGSLDPDNDPLTYNWDFGDGTSSTATNPLKSYTTKGTYIVQLTVSDGTDSAQARPIIINSGEGPTITIGSPANGTLYKAGDTINFTVHATDSAGLDVADNKLSTDIIFHHHDHIHPYLNDIIGRTGSFLIPDKNHEPNDDVWFEIQATATDTNGLKDTKSIVVVPEKSNMTFQTIPSGLQILLDGSPINTPQTVLGVKRYQRELNTPSIQTQNGKYYIFESWSTNQPQKHTLVTPESDTVYTATFKEIPAPTQTVFKPVADTYVSVDAKGTNYGKANIIHTDGIPEKISYLKFDLSSLSNKTIAEATLRLRIGDNPSEGTQVIKEVGVDNWSETGMTFNNRPAVGGSLSSLTTGDIANIWQEVSLKDYASQNKGSLLSLAVDSTHDDSIVFQSRESAFSPELVVTSYIENTTPTPTPLTPTPTNAIPTPTPTGTSDVITLKPVADASVDSTAPNSNLGGFTTMQTDGLPMKISYLRFDLSSLAGKTITNAVLRLRTADNPSEGTQSLKTVANTSWSETTLNYNNRPATGPAIATLNTGDIANVWNEVNVKEAVQSSIGNGLSLAIDSTHEDSIVFYTKESAFSPELIIYFSGTGSSSTTLNPLADTYADIDNKNTSYGASTLLFTDGTPFKVIYMLFDATSLAGKNITSAKLKLRVGNNSSENSQNIKEVTDTSWQEATLTYNNRPALSNTIISTLNTGDVTEAEFEIDIKTYLQTKAGQKFSIAFDSNDEDAINFYSKESIYKPQILITYQ